MIKELLLKAADKIEDKGWWRDQRDDEEYDAWRTEMPEIDPDYRVCMAIAISGHDAYKTEARKYLAGYLGLSVNDDYLTQLYNWNDTHTKEEVVAALRGAAATCE